MRWRGCRLAAAGAGASASPARRAQHRRISVEAVEAFAAPGHRARERVTPAFGRPCIRDRGVARVGSRRFYRELVRVGFAHGARVGALVLLAQVATAVGFVREAGAARRASCSN
jgi:hypothetical protein